MALRAKQEAFIIEYLKCFNATQAAIAAGYSEKTAGSIGSENLKKPDISAAIREKLTENAISAEEALSRLGEQARGTMADFISIRAGLPFVDLEKAERLGKLHLLKKFRITDKGVEIELHDAQSALVHILRELHLRADEPTERGVIEQYTTLELSALTNEQLAILAANLKD